MRYKVKLWLVFALTLTCTAFVSAKAQSSCTFAISPTSESAYSGTFTVTPTPSSCSYNLFSYYGPNVTPYFSLANPATGTQTFTYTNSGPTGSSQFSVAVGAFGSPCVSYFCAFTGQLALLPFSIFPAGASSLQVLTTTIPNTVVGTIYPSIQLQATGGTPPYTWRCSNCDGTPYQSAGPLTVSSSGLVTSLPSYGYNGGQFTNSSTLYSLLINVTDAAGNIEVAVVPYESLPASSLCANYGGDTDGDGLCDNWEINGYTASDGSFVNLRAMGANPMHKDIFVQTDYMTTCPAIGCLLGVLGHSHQPKIEAMELVTQALAMAPVNNPDGTTGITLHVDCGPECVMNPTTGQQWGPLSQAQAIFEQSSTLGSNIGTTQRPIYNFGPFYALRMEYSPKFSVERQQAFHYVIFAHSLGGFPNVGGIAHRQTDHDQADSDFIVSLGSAAGSVGTTEDQASVFMHELGHNLSLRHGGSDDINHKPNYLSIMNYSFEFPGLIINRSDGNLDYSRFQLPTLDESALNENTGLGDDLQVSSYGTKYFCTVLPLPALLMATGSIDWNCNGQIDAGTVWANITGDPDNTQLQNYSVLNGYNDWPNLVYNGGGIGALSAGYTPSDSTSMSEPDIVRFPRPFEVQLVSPGVTQLQAGKEISLTFTVINTGTESDTYTLTPSSSVSWADLSIVPTSISLASGTNTQITIATKVPANATIGTVGVFSIKALSQGNPNVLDAGYAQITVVSSAPQAATSPTFSPAAGTFTAPQTVTISDATSGAAIYYTTNGTAPTTSSTLYSGPITVSSTETIRAIATANGYSNSPVVSDAYTITLPQDFTLGLSSSALTVTAGQTGTLTASIAPVNGFNQAATFSCSGLPSGAACSFSPATVTPNGTASATTSVTIMTSATIGLLNRGRPYELAGLLAGLSLLFAGRRFRRLGRIGVLLLSVIGVGSAAGCGNHETKIAPTTSTVSINATSGSLTHTAPLTLTVQ